MVALLDVSVDRAAATIESVAALPEHCRQGLAPEPGLVAVHAFLHMVDVGREAEMRDQFGRVYVCRCYEREVWVSARAPQGEPQWWGW